jgi:interleukin-1 receptor-associated kinase 1
MDDLTKLMNNLMQATPLLESGNLKALLDPKTNGNFDVVQMQRMVLAATLCVRQTARLRPKVSQVLNSDIGLLQLRSLPS